MAKSLQLILEIHPTYTFVSYLLAKSVGCMRYASFERAKSNCVPLDYFLQNNNYDLLAGCSSGF